MMVRTGNWNEASAKLYRNLKKIVENSYYHATLIRRTKVGAKNLLCQAQNTSTLKIRHKPLRYIGRRQSFERETIHTFKIPGVSWQRVLAEQTLIVYFIYAVARNLLPLDTLLASFGFKNPYNCYVPGRFVFDKYAGKPIEVMACMTLLSWRLIYRSKEPKMECTMLTLYQDPEELERKRATICEAHRELKDGDLLFRYLLCFRVPSGGRQLYMLRPNRTREAHDELVKQALLIGAIVNMIIVSLLAIVFALCLHEILLDERYVLAYPHCLPEYDERYESGKLEESYRISFSGHKVIATLMDGLENTLVWGGGLSATIYTIAVVYLLNWDILLYWEKLSSKLDNLLAEARRKYKNSLRLQLDRDVSIDVRKLSDGDMFYGPHSIGYTWRSTCRSSVPENQIDARVAFFCDPGADEAVYEFQSMMFDFFEQFANADKIVSDLTTIAYAVWIATHILFTRLYLASLYESLTIIRIFQMLGFLLLLVLNLCLWIISRRLRRAYTSLCSLIALDESRHKHRYLRVLDYFTQERGRRSAFTILHKYPVAPTTFLWLVSWSLSCMIILEKLFQGLM